MRPKTSIIWPQLHEADNISTTLQSQKACLCFKRPVVQPSMPSFPTQLTGLQVEPRTQFSNHRSSGFAAASITYEAYGHKSSTSINIASCNWLGCAKKQRWTPKHKQSKSYKSMARAQYLLPAMGAIFVTNLPHSKQQLTRHSIPLTKSLKGFTSPRKFILAAHSRENEPQSGTSKLSAIIEYSESANEELLLFLFQLDLATRIQRALNQDQYEAAQLFREKMNEVEKEVARKRQGKTGAVSAKEEVQDKEIALLRLSTELTKSIEKEDYEGAARLRDQISKLEAESLAASAKALASQKVEYLFRLGQKVKHKSFGYRGVICGMDPICCESEKWVEAARINELPRLRNQPFYQVLVDAEKEPELVIAYVAEENLEAPTKPDLEALSHPYIYFLFYGMDGAGDYIPTKQLRQKYDAPRHELPDDPDSPSTQS